MLEQDDLQPSAVDTAKSSVPNEADILKRKLEEMEKQMAALKNQLQQKNEHPAQLPKLKDVGLDFKPTPDKQVRVKQENSSLLNTQESDSSEDEEGNCNTNKYNEYGQFVKKRLAHHNSSTVDRIKGQNCPQGWKANQGALTKLTGCHMKSELPSASDNGYADPFFGINVVNPLVGSSTLMQKMEGRKKIKLSQIKIHMRGGDIKDDWVTMAVVVFKGEPRTSQNGKKFCIWKLTDLKDCTKQVSFFLFGDVFTTHWKMAVGSVIGILNPNFMKDNKPDEISFTIDHHQKILHVGGSKVCGYRYSNFIRARLLKLSVCKILTGFGMVSSYS